MQINYTNTTCNVGFSDNPIIVDVQMSDVDFPELSSFRMLHVKVATEEGIHEFRTTTDNNERTVIDVKEAFRAIFTEQPLTPAEVLQSGYFTDPAHIGVVQVYYTYRDHEGVEQTSASKRHTVYALRGGLDEAKRYFARAIQPSELILRQGLLSTKPEKGEVVNLNDHELIAAVHFDTWQTEVLNHVCNKTGWHDNLRLDNVGNTYYHSIAIGFSLLKEGDRTKLAWRSSEKLPCDVRVPLLIGSTHTAVNLNMENGSIGVIDNELFNDAFQNYTDLTGNENASNNFGGIFPNPNSSGAAKSTVVWAAGVRFSCYAAAKGEVSENSVYKSAAKVLGSTIHIQLANNGAWYASQPIPEDLRIRVREKVGGDIVELPINTGEYEGTFKAIGLTIDLAERVWSSTESLPSNIIISADIEGEGARRFILQSGANKGLLDHRTVRINAWFDGRTFHWKTSLAMEENLGVSIPIKNSATGGTNNAAYVLGVGKNEGSYTLPEGSWNFTGELPILHPGLRRYTYEGMTGSNIKIEYSGNAYIKLNTTTGRAASHNQGIALAAAGSISGDGLPTHPVVPPIDPIGPEGPEGPVDPGQDYSGTYIIEGVIESDASGTEKYAVHSVLSINKNHETYGFTEFETADSYSRSFYVEDNPMRHEFLFINSFGVLENASAICLEKKEVKFTSEEFNREQEPSFIPQASITSSVIRDRDRWSMSSGYVTRDWAEWWINEFLTARKHWIRLSNNHILPVTIKPADKYTVYDKSKGNLASVEFTVSAGIRGNINL